MILAVDTQYTATGCTTAGVLFEHWQDASCARELTKRSTTVEPYQPGEFFKRELPPIRSLLSLIQEPLSVIVIDGYVWLDERRTPGLGAHLYAALDQSTAVVGVAKSAFKGSLHAEPVLRGSSQRPLYVTAAGIDARRAARYVSEMQGSHRLPDLLRRVDRLCRQHV